MDEQSVHAAVTLYFLQQSSPDEIEESDVIVTVASPSSHVLTELASLMYSTLVLLGKLINSSLLSITVKKL
jgi:hypothetical protein